VILTANDTQTFYVTNDSMCRPTDTDCSSMQTSQLHSLVRDNYVIDRIKAATDAARQVNCELVKSNQQPTLRHQTENKLTKRSNLNSDKQDKSNQNIPLDDLPQTVAGARTIRQLRSCSGKNTAMPIHFRLVRDMLAI